MNAGLGLRLALAATIALTGCSGGGLTPNAVGSLTPSAGAGNARTARAGKHVAKVRFTMKWPQRHRSTRQTTTKKPRFISPSTMAVIVEVNSGSSKPGPVTFANNPGTASATHITIEAPVGKDDFVISLYDQPQKTNELKPRGNELGQAEVVKTIVAGKENVLDATVAAVPSNATVAPLPNQPFLEPDTVTGGYDLVGDAPATFAVTAYDVDGNVIVPPGAPTYALSPSGNSVPFIVVKRVKGHANEFTVATTAPAPVAYHLAVVPSASGADGRTSVTGTPVALSTLSAVYVSYAQGTGSKMQVYDANGKPVSLPASAFGGLSDPVALAYSHAKHRLFVADAGLNAIVAFDSAGNPAAGFTQVAVTDPNGVAYDPHNNTVYATTASNVIAFTPNGAAVTLAAGAFGNTAAPTGVTYASLNANQASQPQIVVGSTNPYELDFYTESGALNSTVALTPQVANPPTIRGMAFVNLYGNTSTVALSGGTSPNGYVYERALIGYDAGNPSSATSAFGGLDVDYTIGTPVYLSPSQAQPELFVAESDANVIQGFPANNLYGGADAAHTIVTPASSTLTTPQAVAIAP